MAGTSCRVINKVCRQNVLLFVTRAMKICCFLHSHLISVRNKNFCIQSSSAGNILFLKRKTVF